MRSPLESLVPVERSRKPPWWRELLELGLRGAYPFSWPARVASWFPGTARVRRVDHVLPLLPAGARELSLAFMSDLHVGPTTPTAALDRAFELVEEARPDVLLLGGDYVFLDAGPRRLAELESRVRSLNVPVKLAVLGNHDLWTDPEPIEAALWRAGARVLFNESVTLPDPHGDVAVVGVDDPWAGRPSIADALLGTEAALLKIGLCHSPEGLPLFRGAGVSLLLCGHTHGGQIAIPPHRPLLYGGKIGRDYIAGLYDLDELSLFVSRGVGTVVLPFRVFSPPEVVHLRLVPGGTVRSSGSNGTG